MLGLPRGIRIGVSVLAAGIVAACSSSPHRPAPVEDRGTAASAPVIVPPTPAAEPPPPPGAENAGKPGYYTVRPGDTLIRIGLESGQSWKDIARWNSLDNPNLIEVGQVLRVAPPAALAEGGVVSKPVASPSVAPVKPGASGTAPAATPAPAVAAVPVVPAAAAPAGGEEDTAFIWPANGALVAGFDEAKNKGFDIAGKAGEPVLAAADGRVVYAGAGLRGYGNLIILKHNSTYLTAYAHNQSLLVKEDQSVRKGQKIAEMGSSDTDRVKLHFEIRKQGKPVDPAKYLPAK
ncbi:peptidoglycan DD-metalloendopeptidase family protein [Ramlibacter sp. H39-3-26]|uniref:peptidoglycan DD-metalloendopeptidase family protein n=1 Tax=Curvibacter soli TaxID=3031331 RepID=UPI0023D9C9E7|nr:peptidoglycan DD-metalloendopeptidase family protein [Ramlibacter sp. H39-3-26]MDF1485968.1 peptidoglycan DD-metalloendopeptidase family protein [Ramlibacter sp. H39-3-26]